MNHYNDEQFEEIMQGDDIDLTHLRQCQDCQNRLAEKRAIAGRLRLAFDSVRTRPELADRIRSQLGLTSTPAETAKAIHHVEPASFHRRFWPALAAAAAIVLVALPIVLYLGAPSAAHGAQAELVKIHRHNMSPDHEFYSETEPEKLAEYFKSKLGFNPRLPKPGQGLALRGCCVKHFRGEVVGSYVVDTPDGVMSVIVVTDRPESLGIEGRFERGQYTYWKSSFAKCDMVSVRIGDYTYCAVGEISHEHLSELLSHILGDGQE
jgi:hypothetical protein